MPDSHWSQHIPVRRIAIVASVLLVLAILFPSTLRVLFAADKELSFSAGLGMTTCRGPSSSQFTDASNCLARYDIVLGNTGSEIQERIEIHLDPVPVEWRVAYNTQDIVASARRPSGPQIEYQQTGSRVVFLIENLGPNRLIDLSLMSSGEAALHQFESTVIEIDADAVLIETNPRLTVVSRFFRNLYSVFGF